MKHLKLDPMTVLFVVVIMGVVGTISTQASTQASDRSILVTEVLQAPAQSAGIVVPIRH